MKRVNKKVILGFFTLVLTFLLSLPSLNAASCRISVSAPSSVVVGNNFTVKVTVSSNASIGSWDYTLSYDSSKVRHVSGDLRKVDYGNGSKKSITYSYTFKALKSSSATFKPVNASVLDYASVGECLSSVGSATVTMRTMQEIEASYSRNNNLSSLSVEGAELTPAFNKDTLEYEATLPIDTVQANIIATPEDSKSTITGAGVREVMDGANKIEVVVTAQHGEVKTYVINLTVLEMDPIKITLNGKEYSIIRKAGQIKEIPEGFTETKVKIEDQEIVAYESEIANLTLVGLKDNEGNAKLFIYDKIKKEFKSMNQTNSKETKLFILNNTKEVVPSDFKSTSFTYNKNKVNGYKLIGDKSNRYFLVYAINIENGKEDFYLYDTKEKTFQVYYEKLVNIKNKDILIREYIIIGLLIVFVLSLLIKILKAFKSPEKRIKKYQAKINKLKEKVSNIDELDDSYDISDLDDKPTVKKVETDYVIPKKSKKQKLKEINDAKKKLDESKNNKTVKRVSLEDDE